MIKEAYDSNPGNNINLGVTNHLTPINNIITNIRNLFAPMLSLVVEPGEDNFSIRIHSSKFTNQKEVEKVLYSRVYNNLCLAHYVTMQGLTTIKLIPTPMYWIVYFGPDDIKAAAPAPKGIKEQKEWNLGEIEYMQATYNTISEAYSFEDEIEDTSAEDLKNILSGKNKVKACAAFAELIGSEITLPDNYYWKAVRDADGNESIALRMSYEKKRPFGKTATYTKSVLNIYGVGKDAIWVDDYDEEGVLSDEVKSIVDNVLGFMGASQIDGTCSFSIGEATTDTKKKEGDEEHETKDGENENNPKDKDKENSKEKETSPESNENNENNKKPEARVSVGDSNSPE